MKLHFNRADVEKILKHSKEATAHTDYYGTQCQPGDLFLVGDQGVYLMSSAVEGLMRDDNPEGQTNNFVVYAKEIDPKLPFDEWWSNKRMSFGGDDGADIISLEMVEQMFEFGNSNTVCIDVSPEQIKIAKP